MLYGVQFLRFVAALLVVAHHSFTAVESQLVSEHLPLMAFIFEFGAVGVHVFFVISGFIITYTQRRNFGKPTSLQFLAGRIERIYPLYWFCAAVTILIYVTIGHKSLPESIVEWVAAVVLFPGYAESIIFVGWTLAYEMFFYLVFAAILTIRLNMRNSLLVISAIFLICVALGKLTALDKHISYSVITSVLLMEFLLGAWVAYLVTVRPNVSKTTSLVIMLLGIAGFAAGLATNFDAIPRVISWGLPSTLLICGVVYLDRCVGPINLLTRFRRLGDASYALYLIHPSIIALLTFPNLILDTLTLHYFFAFLAVSLVANIYISVLLNRHLEPRIKLFSKPA